MLPDALKVRRKERGLSQAALATATGKQCSEGLIAQIETGRRQPGLANAVAIAKALDVPLSAIALIYVSAEELAAASAAITVPVDAA